MNAELHLRMSAVKESRIMSENNGLWEGPEFKTGLAHLTMARQTRQRTSWSRVWILLSAQWKTTEKF